jgi:hypothetical protein
VVDGVRLGSNEIAAWHAPWTQEVEDELSAAGLNTREAAVGLDRWEQTRHGEYFKFTARYLDGSSIEVVRNGAFRNVITR